MEEAISSLRNRRFIKKALVKVGLSRGEVSSLRIRRFIKHALVKVGPGRGRSPV